MNIFSKLQIKGTLFIILAISTLVLFPENAYSKDGVGEFIIESIKAIFYSKPVKEMRKLKRAVMKLKGNDKEYLDALLEIESSLEDYNKNRIPKKLETIVNITLALTRFRIHELTSDKEACRKSSEAWKIGLKKYNNLILDGGDEIRILKKHGHFIDIEFDENDWEVGRNWIKENQKKMNSCVEEIDNCCDLKNYIAVGAYNSKLRNKVEKILRLYKNYEGTKRQRDKLNDYLSDIISFSNDEKNNWANTAPIAYNLMRGLLYEIKRNEETRKYPKREYGNYAHRGLNKVKECLTKFSYEYKELGEIIEKELSVKLDSNWVYSRYEDSKLFSGTVYTCLDSTALNYDSMTILRASSDSIELHLADNVNCSACIYKGCISDPDAFNYIGDKKGKLISTECIYEGCMDECYSDYDSKNTIPGDCIGIVICACKDSCYVGFSNDPDKVHKKEYCDSLKNICGCTNPCSPRYSADVKTDDGSCGDSCGCKDPIAENYNSLVVYHNQDSCLYKKPEKEIVDNPVKVITDFNNLVNQLPNERIKQLLKQVDFSEIQDGGGLRVDISQSKLRITTGKGGEDLGKYDFIELRETVDFILDFLQGRSARRFSLSELKGVVVGESDGSPIKSNGIQYIGNNLVGVQFSVFRESDRNLLPDYFSRLDFNANQKSIDVIASGGLYNGDRFGGNYKGGSKGNQILGFIRATKIKEHIEATKAFSSVKMGAVENRSRGGDYRRVTIILDFENYNYLPTNQQVKGKLIRKPNATIHSSINKDCLCQQ